MARLFPAAVVLLMVFSTPLASQAAEPRSAKAAKKTAPKIELQDLGLGSVGGELPKADGLKKPGARVGGDIAPTVTTRDVQYTVLEVQHAAGFVRGAAGAKPVGGLLPAVVLAGDPPTTQPFTTLVKVKATQQVNASIELVILDPRGDTALSGRGELVFAHGRNDEVDYLIDWAPVARASGGHYQLLVRIAGKPMGTWPLEVEKR